MTEAKPLLSRKRLGLPLSRLLLILILLGPPTLREGREAATAFESPLVGLDWTYILHLGVWGFAGLYAISRFLLKPLLFANLLFHLTQRSPSRWYLFFAIICLLSAAWSIFPLYTVFFAYKIWVTIFLVLSLAQEAKVRGLSSVEVLLQSVVLAYSLGLILLSLLFLISPELVTQPTPGVIGFRLTGGFLADYGAYALITLAFLGTRYLFRKRNIMTSILITLALLWALVAIILAQTRSTLMAFFLMCLVVILFGTRGLRRVVWFTGFAISGFLALALAGEMILAFLLRGQDLEGVQTLSGRTLIFSFLIEYWKESPLLGWGFQAGSRYAAVQFLEQTGMNMGAAHDVISKVLVDLGLVGAFVLLSALISLLSSLVNLRKRVPREQWLLLTTLALYGLTASISGAGVGEARPVWVVLFIVPSLAYSRVTEKSQQGGTG